ncbi:hypothetical protein H8959_019291 [Pygathrix nigripes]
MYQPEDDNSSDVTSDDDMARNRGESSPPHSVHSFSGDRDWDRRGRSRDMEPRDRWSYTRNPRSRLPQRDLSLPVMAKTSFEMERDDDRDSRAYESRSQVKNLKERFKKISVPKVAQLIIGVQLAEDDGHSHMTQGHSSRSKRSAYPSTSRGLKTMPEAKKSTHRRGICEDESSHGVIMEKFIKDVSRNSKSGRARESSDQSQRFPRMSDANWKDVSLHKRESVIQQRVYEGNAFRGGFRFNSTLVSRKRVLERKRRYHFDTDGKGSIHDQKGCPRKKPFECGSEVRKAVSMSNLSSLSSPSFTDLASVEAQKSHSVAGPSKPKVTAESAIQSFDAINHPRVRAGGNTSEGREYSRSVIHSLVTSKPPRSHSGNELVESNEKGEFSIYVLDLNDKRQKIPARENPCEGGSKNHNYEDSVIQSISHARPQKSVPGEGSGEFKKDGEFSVPSSNVREYQKARAKKKYIEHRSNETSVIHSLPFEQYAKEQAWNKFKEFRQFFATSKDLNTHQKIYDQEKSHGEESQGEKTRGEETHGEETYSEETHGKGTIEDPVIQGSDMEDPQKDDPDDTIYECEDCGLGFVDLTDLTDHQKVHSRKCLVDSREYTHSPRRNRAAERNPALAGSAIRCLLCGQGFIHSSALNEHMRLHREDDLLEQSQMAEEAIIPGLALTEFQRTAAAAAAQEVEANVHVPQVVLRIQGSNVEVAEPEVEAAEPEVEAAEPEVEAAEPNGEAEGPDGEAAEPNGEAEQPNGEAEQPNGDADEPDGAGIEDPEERAEEPEGKAEEPEGDADEPDGVGIEDPEEAEDQEIQVEEPYYDCHECTETFTSSTAFGEHLKTHASMIIFEPANAFGECSGYIERASTSTGGANQADEKYFKCDVCGQLFSDRLSLARHQNTHTG